MECDYVNVLTEQWHVPWFWDVFEMIGFLFPFSPKLNFGRGSINIQRHRWMVWWPRGSWVPLPLTKLVRYQDDSHHESDVSVSRHHQIEMTLLFVGRPRSLVTRVMILGRVWNDRVSFSFQPETQLRSLIYKHPIAMVIFERCGGAVRLPSCIIAYTE